MSASLPLEGKVGAKHSDEVETITLSIKATPHQSLCDSFSSRRSLSCKIGENDVVRKPLTLGEVSAKHSERV